MQGSSSLKFRFLTLNTGNFIILNYRKAQWWDTNEPYHYIRTEEREDYDVLIVGGNDNPAGIKAERDLDPYGSLEKWTRERWSNAEEVLYKWTGQVTLFKRRCPIC